MAKKKEQVKDQLSEGEYWRFKHALAQIKIAEEEKKNIEASIKFLAQEVEKLNVRMALIKVTNLVKSQQKIEEARSAYALVKEDIENSIGRSLNNASIDEITYKVIYDIEEI